MDRQDGPGEKLAVSVLSLSRLSFPVEFEALEELYTYGGAKYRSWKHPQQQFDGKKQKIDPNKIFS